MVETHRFTPDSVAFDDENLVSHAGLVPILTLAERTGLHQLLTDKVTLRSTAVASTGTHVAPKLTTIIAGMCAEPTASTKSKSCASAATSSGSRPSSGLLTAHPPALPADIEGVAQWSAVSTAWLRLPKSAQLIQTDVK